MRTIVLQGSARSHGHTRQVLDELKSHLAYDCVDLHSLTIHPYDYGHTHQGDDFLPLMQRVVSYERLLLATPVYWYAMSGLMKTFLDRITDCLKIDKPTGRKLRGMELVVLSCGSDDIEHEGFFVPFQKSADYLGMTYGGQVHTWISEPPIPEEVRARLKTFAEGLKSIPG